MDWEDDLLALAEAPAPKKKKKQKKRKREMSNSDDDMDISAGSDEELQPVKVKKDDDEDDAEGSDAEEVLKGPRAYPLEGLYKNEQDKRWLMEMTELDREQILDDRRAEIEQYTNRQLLKQMVAGGSSAKKEEDSDSDDAYSKPSRRKPATAKAKQLDELKRRRKAKSERDEKRARRRDDDDGSDDENKPHASRTDFSWSSDDESPEEGEEEEDEDEYGKTSTSKVEKKKVRAGKDKQVEMATREDLQRIVLRRGRLAEFWPCSFFQEYVEDAYVRIGVGQDKGNAVYRLAKIVGVAPNRSSRGYKLDRHMTNIKLTLAIGKDKRDFTMEMISNSDVEESEFNRFIKTLAAAGMDPPTKKEVEEKRKVLDKYRNYTLTESDVNTIINVKKDLARGGGDLHLRHTLMNRRDIALRSGDAAALAAIDKEIEEYDSRHGGSSSRPSQGSRLSANGSNSSLDNKAVTPSGPLTLEDRRKHLAQSINITTPRALAAKQNLSQTSRPGSGASTPQRQLPVSENGKNTNATSDTASGNGTTNSSTAPGQQKTRFQELLAKANVEVDLGDF